MGLCSTLTRPSSPLLPIRCYSPFTTYKTYTYAAYVHYFQHFTTGYQVLLSLLYRVPRLITLSFTYYMLLIYLYPRTIAAYSSAPRFAISISYAPRLSIIQSKSGRLLSTFFAPSLFSAYTNICSILQPLSPVSTFSVKISNKYFFFF